jgi:NitT/TauT family transport system ATP-binding protein
MIVRNVPIDSFIAAPVFLSSKKATSIVTRGASALPYDNPERVFQTMIAWGRYAGLMDINNKTRLVFIPKDDEVTETGETRF